MLGASRRRRAGIRALLVAALYATAAAWVPIAHAQSEVLQAAAAVSGDGSLEHTRFHSDALCGIGIHPQLSQPAATDVEAPAAGTTAITLPAAVAPHPGPEHCASLPRAPPTS